MNGTDELYRLEIASRTRLGLIELWLKTEPAHRRQLVKRVVLGAVFAFVLYASVVYLIVLPVNRQAGQLALIIGGVLAGGVMLLLAAPPGPEAAGMLARIRSHWHAEAQGRIALEEAADKLGIESGIPLAQDGAALFGIAHGASQGHVFVCAPTRSGKGLHLTTTLLHYPASALIIDPKGEQYDRTSGYRWAHSQTIYHIPGHSVDLNLFYDLTDPDDAAELHHQLLRPPERAEANSIFYYKSRPLFQGIGRYARAKGKNAVRSLILASATPMLAVLQRLDDCPESHPFLRQFTDDIDPHDVSQIGAYKLITNAWGTFSTAMEPLVKHVDTIAPRPGAPNVIPLDWASKDSSLYITYGLQDLRAAVGPLVSAIIAAMMRYQVKTDSRARLLFAIDELPAVALQGLSTYLATVAGYNISMLLYVQDIGQLESVYGQREAQTILGNCSSQVWYPPNDIDTAQLISRLYGTKLHTSIGAVGMAIDPARNRTPELRYTEQFMPALGPTEVMSLEKSSVVVLCQAGERQWRFIAQRCDPRARLASLPPAVPVPHVSYTMPVVASPPTAAPAEAPVEIVLPVPAPAFAAVLAGAAVQQPLPGIEAPHKKARRREGGGF